MKTLLKDHSVVVVKPIVVQKLLVKRASKDGPITGRRVSPKRGTLLDLFDDLVHFTGVFPHRRLTLEVPLVDIEEWRYPGHGRRRRWRRDDYQVEDQKLVAVHATYRFQTAADLARLVERPMPRPFHTGHLAESLRVQSLVGPADCLLLPPDGSRARGGQTGEHPALRVRRCQEGGLSRRACIFSRNPF